MNANAKPTILQATRDFLEMTALARSENTHRSYRNGINIFLEILADHQIDPKTDTTEILSEEALAWLLTSLKSYAPATEQLYTIATTRFYQYLLAEDLANVNLQKIQLIVRNRSRRPGQRLPQFPKEDLQTLIKYAQELPTYTYATPREQTIAFRDSALILVLADTGLRVHEACNLRRGDIDWNEQKALVIGKGDQQAVVRFSSRSIKSIQSYLNHRAAKDGSTGRALASLPIFARHDKGAGKKILPISTTTARNIIKQRTKEILGEQASKLITPHSFRHFFVTNVLLGSGGNLKLAQELARHKNIQVTQRYAHLSDDELDEGYHNIFEERPGR